MVNAVYTRVLMAVVVALTAALLYGSPAHAQDMSAERVSLKPAPRRGSSFPQEDACIGGEGLSFLSISYPSCLS